MKLDVSPQLQLPEDAVTRAFALLAMKGAGKSNAAVVMAEKMFDAGIPWVAIDPKGDWWGIRSSADGKPNGGLPIPIFGGLNADVPLDPSNGALMADLIVDQHLTCLIDVSEMSKNESISFLTPFFERLYRRKSRETYPMHLFLEECDDYVPQRVYDKISNLVRQVELVVKRGRQRGIGITLATQRSASVNKDVLTQTDTLIALRTTSPQDRKAIKEWIDYHSSAQEVIDELPTLRDGEAWVSSPEHLRFLGKIRFRRRRTFDSGATPALGSKVKPATLADIDLAAISTVFAETIEKARAKDPKTLHARIQELERTIRSYEKELKNRPTEKEVVEVQVVPAAVTDRLTTLEANLSDLIASVDTVSSTVHHSVDNARAALISAQKANKAQPTTKPVKRPNPTRRVQEDKGAVPVDIVENDDDELAKGAMRMLGVLHARYPLWVTNFQLGLMSGFAPSGGTFRTYLGRLKTLGLVEVRPFGRRRKDIRISEAGIERMGGLRESDARLLDFVRPALRKGEGAMLDLVVEVYPNGLSKTELGDGAGFEPTGGTFRTYLGALKTNGLVNVHDDIVTATPELFE